MLEKDIKLMVSNGFDFDVTVIANQEGYHIVLRSRRNGERHFLDTQRGDRRLFKSLDSCRRTLESIGILDFDVSIL